MGGYNFPAASPFDDEDPKTALAGILSPQPAHALVMPPPSTPPRTAPGVTTPQTGSLAYAPTQAVAKNSDSLSNSFRTGVSNPANGGYGATISSDVQPVSRGVQPVVQAGMPQQVNPAQVGPDTGGFARPGGTTTPMPVLPQSGTQVNGPSQLDRDQSRLAYLTNSGSGIDQIKNPVGRTFARIGDIALGALAPGIAAAVPGTTLHHQQLLGQAQGIVGNDQAQQQAAAQTADTNQQAAQRAGKASLEQSQAEADQLRAPTPEEVTKYGLAPTGLYRPSDIGRAAVQGLRNTGNEAVGSGHDVARITVGQGNNATSAANNAATNATRVATSKYGPGNRGSGAGTGEGPAIPVGQPGDLSGVPANVRGLVQAIGEGREGPAPLGRKDGKEIMRLVSQVYPDYDASQFHNYQATRTEFSKGKTGQAINSFNTSLQHLGRMENNLPNNGSIPALNSLKNWALKETGSAVNSPFEADRLAVASEIGKAYKGGVLSKEENDQYQKLLDRDASPAQQKANIGELKGLLSGKLNSFNEQYKTALPTGATRGFQIISPEANAVLNRGQSQGPQPVVQPAGPASQQGIPAGNIRVQLSDGRTGHIAASQRTQFLKDNPGAKTF